MPEIVDVLAREGQALRWNENASWYEVLNGAMFEEKFNGLRCTRGKRKEQAVDRPFARMHTYFVLVRGEKWAGTGSAFRPKATGTTVPVDRFHEPRVEHDQSAKLIPGRVKGISIQHLSEPHTCPANTIKAENVEVRLRGPSATAESSDFTCSLQYFLDVTGAGDLYMKHICKDLSESNAADSSNASPEAAQRDLSDWTGHVPDNILTEQDIARLVGTAWDEDCKGDQAYFFFREDGTSYFSNGSIVVLRNGRLDALRAGDYVERGISGQTLDANDKHTDVPIFLVVSDNNAKWKGAPLPTKEEEKHGHWCAFLGQVC